MKKTNYSEKTLGELKNQLQLSRKELLNLRIEKEQRKQKDVHVILNKKREIARVLTALKQKEFAK